MDADSISSPQKGRQQDQGRSQQEQQGLPGIMPADRPDQVPEPAGSEKDNAGGAEEQSAQGEDGEEGIGGGDPRKDQHKQEQDPGSCRSQPPWLQSF